MQDYVGKQIDRYRITERLGMGGMAVVYKAYDNRLQRDVALKLIRTGSIPPDQYQRLMKRFEREAVSQAKISHPNIVPVHDYGEVDGSPYLVQEYVPGGTLKDRIGRPADYRQAISWLAPIADALAYTHEMGVIHRDVKPSNILFDQKGRSLLTDFGIAKILETNEATLTGTGLGVGTPEYMAPEQWQGQATEGSDQYALGVVLYELLTGKKPYNADTPVAVALLQMTEPLIAPSKLVTGIPEGLEKILYKALSRHPSERYEDMASFYRALARFESEKIPSKLDAIPTTRPAAQPNARPPVDSEGITIDVLSDKPTQVKAPAAQQKLKEQEQSRKKRFPKWLLWLGIGSCVMIIIGIFVTTALLGLRLINRDNVNEPVSNGNETATVSERENSNQIDENTLSSNPTATSQQSQVVIDTEAPTISVTSTATLGIGSTLFNKLDGAEVAYVPAGEFIMGGQGGNALVDEVPEHKVKLDAFWIYKNEVTYAQFLLCMQEGGCPSANYTIEASNAPKVYVSWYEAQEYCIWAGGRLPTEAQWEKAARGTDGRLYPWGNNTPNNSLANFYPSSPGKTMPVGSYPQGASPYGVLDMAGNVMEWVNDWYSSDYYSVSPDVNPLGPELGDTKVFRGSSFYASAAKLRVTIRHNYPPNDTYDNIGFRCVYIP